MLQNSTADLGDTHSIVLSVVVPMYRSEKILSLLVQKSLETATALGPAYKKEMNTQAVNDAIAALPDVPRHWLQLGKDNWLRALVLRFMPRLEYAFKQ